KFVGTKVKKIKSRFYKLRRSLQATGTPSAKRHLKKLSGKERRYMKHVNHIISKRLVQKASRLGYRIALEDLSGIRDEDRGKLFNRMIGGWSFYQLQTFIEYKAREKGIDVVYVDSRNTSKSCSNCRQLGTRRKRLFVCLCGYWSCPDRNGARNIAFSGSVNNRIVASSELMQCVSLHA
ncbi:MAG: RNA-guided endonuclease TnpB family protein, partial [Ignavibacteriales bacterium]